MSEALPSISDMYRSNRENRDYGVVRKYQNKEKTTFTKVNPTKRGHYLDDEIKKSNSPGPANKANKQFQWTNSKIIQSKHSQRITFIDETQRVAKKYNLPSPLAYNVKMNWQKPVSNMKTSAEKLTFVDTSLYYGEKVPGVGNYQVTKIMGCNKQEGKIPITQPLKPRQNVCAQMCTYSPVPLDYSTFSRIQINQSKSTPNIKTIPQKTNNSKQNLKPQVPGPGYYNMINHWQGKSKLKGNQKNYLDKISRKINTSIYY